MPRTPEGRSAIVLAAVGDEPATTSQLYDRVGYPELLRADLIQYERFRAVLVKLAAEGRVESATDEDGATVWRRPAPD